MSKISNKALKRATVKCHGKMLPNSDMWDKIMLDSVKDELLMCLPEYGYQIVKEGSNVRLMSDDDTMED